MSGLWDHEVQLHKFSAILIEHEGQEIYAQITIWDDGMRKHVEKVFWKTLPVTNIETSKKCLKLWIYGLDITQVAQALNGSFPGNGLDSQSRAIYGNITVSEQIQCFGCIGRVLFYAGELSKHNVNRAAKVINEIRGQ